MNKANPCACISGIAPVFVPCKRVRRCAIKSIKRRKKIKMPFEYGG